MREIKFRGKRLDNGEWLYGNLVELRNPFNHEDSPACFIMPKEVNIADPDSIAEQEVVDPDTVGQFTGLLDKNGKEIYEGDILCQEDRMFHFVEWCRHLAQFRGICHESESAVDIFSLVLMNYKVIGDIHNNPELLEQ